MENEILIKAKDILREIQSVCDDFGLDSLKSTLKSVRNFAGQTQYLDVAVLGQFKAGKSSFLNGFLGKPILPVGNIPVTSVVTRLNFGMEEKAAVTFMDGTYKEIMTDEVGEYVSESGNPENKKNVLLVDIETSGLSKFKKLRLVDTPGTGSVWRHNTETTMSYFPETGAVLFLISAERPVSESELSLLEEVYSYSPLIGIILTKTDLFAEEQLNEVESFTGEAIKKAFEKDFPVMRYSTFANTNAYNSEIEKKFILPLVSNKDKIVTEILQRKIGSLSNSCLSYLNISYQASLKKEDEKEKLKRAVLDEHLNSHFIRRELMLIIGSYKEKTREKFRNYLEGFRKNILEKMKADYASNFSDWKGSLYRVTQRYEEWLKETLSNKLKEILLNEEESFEILNAVKKHLSFNMKNFRERLSENLERTLAVQMKAVEWEIGIGDISKPDISISRTFDFHLDMLWFLFPMFIFRNLFKRFFLGQLPYEVEKNLHRITSDLTEVTNKDMDKLMEQALEYMNKELKTIENLLAETQDSGGKILSRMKAIEKNRSCRYIDGGDYGSK